LGDTIHMHHLTIDLGVRYEVQSPVRLNGANGGTIFNSAGNTFVREIGDYRLGNVAPRVGFAYRLREHTVIRSSYAIEYVPLPFTLIGANITGAGTSSGVPGSFVTTRFAVPAVSTATATPNIPYYVNGLDRTPYVQSYYFVVQQGAPWGFLLDVGY